MLSPTGQSATKFPAILENSSFMKDSLSLVSPMSMPEESVAKGHNLISTPNRTPGSTPQAKKARLSRDVAFSDSEQEPLSCPHNGVISKSLFSVSSEDLEECLEEGGNSAELGKPVEHSAEEAEEALELDECHIHGALTEELKKLQDRNRRMEQELEELERRVVHLSQAKGALEAQLEEVTQVSHVYLELCRSMLIC